MRTIEQIKKIKQHHSDPIQILDFLTLQEIEDLLAYYHQNKSFVEEKNTGPKVLYVNEGSEVIDFIIKKLKDKFGNFNVRSAHFFDVVNPHILHNDDDFTLPNAYKAFTLPLYFEGTIDDIKLIIFNQYYYQGPAKFFYEDSKEREIYYNVPVNNYHKVENLSDCPIDKTYQTLYLGHLKSSWLEGLSVKKDFPWKIGSAICFDSLALHCSSNFKSIGVKRKIGLSIFTTID